MTALELAKKLLTFPDNAEIIIDKWVDDEDGGHTEYVRDPMIVEGDNEIHLL